MLPWTPPLAQEGCGEPAVTMQRLLTAKEIRAATLWLTGEDPAAKGLNGRATGRLLLARKVYVAAMLEAGYSHSEIGRQMQMDRTTAMHHTTFEPAPMAYVSAVLEHAREEANA